MQFLYSSVLFFILIPTLYLFYLITTKSYALEKYFSKNTLEKLSIKNKYFSKKTRNIILLFSLIFMIIALSRPVINEKEHILKQNLISLVIAIDVSKSMKAKDIYPNRLEFAKNKVLKLIDLSNNFSIGIILFAKSSFLISPLTQDLTSLKTLVKNFNTGLNFDNGTNIYSSLELTNKLLKNYENKNLLILSDGGDKKKFDEEINYAKKNHIDIYTLGIGTNKGGVIEKNDGNFLTDKNGSIVNVKINEEIKNLSLSTNAGYIKNTLNDEDIKSIIKDINNKAKKNEFEQKNYKTYTELFYYPLGISIFLLFIAFSSLPNFKNKKIQTFLILFLTIFIPCKNEASLLDFKNIQEANEAYKNSNYKKANNAYEKIDNKSIQKDYNIANTLYKQKKYKEAIKKYTSLKTEDINLNHKKFHNLGNTYVKTKDFKEAIKNYEKALSYKNDKETKENLELVKNHLKKKNNQKQDKNKKQKNKDDKKSKKENSNKNKEENKNKKDDKKNSNSKEKKEKKNNKSQKYSQKDISDKEEKKWLQKLGKKKIGNLIKKFKSSKEDDVKNPW